MLHIFLLEGGYAKLVGEFGCKWFSSCIEINCVFIVEMQNEYCREKKEVLGFLGVL